MTKSSGQSGELETLLTTNHVGQVETYVCVAIHNLALVPAQRSIVSSEHYG